MTIHERGAGDRTLFDRRQVAKRVCGLPRVRSWRAPRLSGTLPSSRVGPSLNNLSSGASDRMHGDHHSTEGRPADTANAAVIDRHLFASPAANARLKGVRPYGWTKGLTQAAASTLTLSLPWPDLPSLGKQAPVLIDGGGGCLDGIGSLREAFHAHEVQSHGENLVRLGFSVTGVIAAEGGGKPRWATHTLLFDEPLFDAVDGFPQGLHMELEGRSGGGCRRAPWFALLGKSMPRAGALLPELDLGEGPDTSRFRDARLTEVQRLVGRACAELSDKDALVHWLSKAYRNVRKALVGEGEIRTMSLGGAPDRLRPDLVRLAWLSLPLIDRKRVYYSTTGSATVTVMKNVQPSAQGRTREDVEFAAWCERHWASLVTKNVRSFRPVAERMDKHRRSLFENRSRLALVVEEWRDLCNSPARSGDIETLFASPDVAPSGVYIAKDPRVVTKLVAAVTDQLTRLDSWDKRWDALLKSIWSGGLVPPTRLPDERLHDLAWAELKVRGALTLAQMVRTSHMAAHLAGRLLNYHRPTFSVDHTLRRALAAFGASPCSAHHDESLPPLDNPNLRHRDTGGAAADGQLP